MHIYFLVLNMALRNSQLKSYANYRREIVLTLCTILINGGDVLNMCMHINFYYCTSTSSKFCL